MPLRIQCANCGKVLILGPGAGTTIVCPACGAPQRAPAYDVVDDIRPQPLTQAQAYAMQQAYAAQQANARQAALQQRPGQSEPGQSRRKRPWVIAAIAVAVVAGVAGALPLARRWMAPSPQTAVEAPWDSSHRNQILNLKAAAEQLAIERKLPEAHAKYQELQLLVAGQIVNDPDERAMIDQARADQELIYKMLISAGGTAQVASSTQPAADPYPARFDPFKVAGGRANGAAPNAGGSAPTRPALPPVPGRPAVQAPAGAGLPPGPGANAENPNTALPPGPATHPEDASQAGNSNSSNPPSPASSGGAATAGGTPLTAGASPRLYQPGDIATDADVSAAMVRGVGFLLSHFKNGDLDDGLSPLTAEHAAQDALVVYALLNAGRALRDPRVDVRGPLMSAALERLKRLPLSTDPNIIQSPVTYGRSLRAAALAVYNRPEDADALAADVAWLVHAPVAGAYTYDDRLTAPRPPSESPPPGRPSLGSPAVPTRFGGQLFERELPGGGPPRATQQPDAQPTIWDNSNSNFAVFAVAAAAEAGVKAPAEYWHDVEKHWTDCQLPDGEWAYNAGQQTGSMAMTCGGVASLLAARDALDNAEFGAHLNGVVFSPPLSLGLGWLEQKDNALDVYNPRTVYLGYNLLGVEHVGMGTGFKHLGKHDWYGELAAQAVVTQWPKGGWGRKEDGTGAIIDTAFVVTFLARGGAPVMMTKLRFPPVWDNRPRDVAGLARFAERELGQPLSWEAVGFDHEWWEWADAPILYVASHRFPQLKDEDEAKVKAFVEGGGVLFTHADASDSSMDKWSTELAKRLFPDYPLTEPTPDSPLYTLARAVPAPLPRLKIVSNGARLLMVHAPNDLALAWQQQDEKNKPGAFAVGVNLFVYAAGRDHWRSRLDPPLVPRAPRPGTKAVPVARLRYAGGWDPEPGAWRRMAAVVPGDTGLSPAAAAVDPAGLKADDYPLAHLTGNGAHAFTDAEITAVRKYVNDGGFLLIDACGGASASGGSALFADSIEKELLPRAFPGSKLEPVTADQPLMNPTLHGMADLTSPRLRPFAADRPNTAGFKFRMASSGKGKILYSPLDLTSGMLGANTWGIVGYDPAYATAVVKNIVVWTAAQRGL